MFICHNPNIVFLAIPKTATRSVYTLLEKNFGGKKFKEHWPTIPKQFSRYFSFCIVRNPYDRAVSQWWSTCMRSGDRYGYVKKMQDMGYGNSLHGFLQVVKRDGWNTSSGTGRVALPQHIFVTPNRINRILHYENLQEEFYTLPFINKNMQLPVINTTNTERHHWSNIVKRDDIALINEIYGDDFAVGEYEKL